MIPEITTVRLSLNGFTFEDSERVESLAGHEAVARTTANIPHPYPPGAAKLWIATHVLAFLKREGVTWAVRLKDQNLIGCISLGISTKDERAELGYWMGLEYWNHGYMTEAAQACVAFGFRNLGLQKITSRYLAFNPASGRVMEKIGMTKEGYLKRHMKKSGILHDVIEFGILKQEGSERV